MARTALDYRSLLMHLLPRGRMWTRDVSSVIAQVMYALGEELARIEGRYEDLRRERDSRYVTELISEMDDEFGLPDATHPLAGTIEQRREDLHGKVVALGGQYEDYFNTVAEAMGYHVTFEYFAPAISGVMSSGDSCGGSYNIFMWRVRVSANGDKKEFNVAFSPEEWYSYQGNSYDFIHSMVRNIDTLMGEFNRIKPAHTYIMFDWWQRAFDRGFSYAFDCFPTNDSIVCHDFNYGYDSSFGNNIDYFGTYLIGAFDTAFNLAFDGHFGWAFDVGDFSSDFARSL
jgi:uncharacterized protein YmfQ (DUF2313 family)